MRKVNLERKIDLAVNELLEAYRLRSLDDPVYFDFSWYRICNALSYLCMIDDYEVENKCTYYCLSEIDRNLKNFVEERKRKENENDNRRIYCVGENRKGC